MTELSRALAQIEAIHEQVARGSVYRGWRPVPVAAAGVVGLAAAAWQSAVPGASDGWSFAVFWIAVAAAAAVVGCAEVGWHYVTRASVAERHQTRLVMAQLLPTLVASAIVTVALLLRDPALAALLPGLWAVLFGVAIFSARPYLPRGSSIVALYFWTAGLLLLGRGVGTDVTSAWAVGGTFGAGQLLSAVILVADRRRGSEGRAQKAEGEGQSYDEN